MGEYGEGPTVARMSLESNGTWGTKGRGSFFPKPLRWCSQQTNPVVSTKDIENWGSGWERAEGNVEGALDPLREHIKEKSTEDVEARARQKVGVLKEVESFGVCLECLFFYFSKEFGF